MLTVIMLVVVFFVSLKMIPIIFRMTWGIAKIACRFLLLPLLVIGLIYFGLVYFAVPVLILLGLAVLVGCLANA